MVIFLDFDGVFHPNRTVIGQHGPKLLGNGSLFMWSSQLVNLLADHPHVQIVLSTSWVRYMPIDQVRAFLPAPIQRRIIGSTWHSILYEPEFNKNLPLTYWNDATRYQQVRRWVNVHRVRRWVAIDDDTEGWLDDDRPNLVQTDSKTGLSDAAVLFRLTKLLVT